MSRNDLLIIHQGALGDFVVTFPVLSSLREKFHRIHALCNARHGALAKMLNLVDKSFPLEAARFATLYSDRIDPGVKEMLAGYREIVLFTWSRRLERAVAGIVGPRAHRISPRPGAWERTHVTRHLWRRLAEIGLVEDRGGEMAADMEKRSLMDAVPPSRLSPGVLVHPGSGSTRKNWPLSNFLQAADMLRRDGFPTVFILGPAERERMNAADIKTGPLANACTPDDLKELAALLLTSDGYIGADSGVSHLAGFIGIPTVAVFGPSDPERWKPNGRAVRVVRPVPDCHPCFEISPRNCDDADCLADITPAMVVGAFYEICENGAEKRGESS